jgi:hypothetical protein
VSGDSETQPHPQQGHERRSVVERRRAKRATISARHKQLIAIPEEDESGSESETFQVSDLPADAPSLVPSEQPATIEQVSPPGPWYIEAGALGEHSVSGVRLPADPARIGREVAGELQAPGGTDPALVREVTRAVADAVRDMLTPSGHSGEAAQREAWRMKHLRTGTFVSARGRSVWIRPVVDRLSHIPEQPVAQEQGPTAREYEVNFGGPSLSSRHETEDAKGIEGPLETMINVASSFLAWLVPVAPTLSIDSKQTRSGGDAQQIVSGRKLMSRGSAGFGAGVRFEVSVDGRSWTSKHVVDDVLDLKFPDVLSGAMENRPVLSRPAPNVALPDYRSPHARVMVGAIDTAPVVRELQEQLRAAKISAEATNGILRKVMEEMLSETSVRNRERWLLSSGDVSSRIREGASPFSAFHGAFMITAKIKRLENITDHAPTGPVRLRDDLGLTSSHSRGRGNSSSVALNLAVDLGGLNAVRAGSDDVGYLAFGGTVGSERSHSSLLGSSSANKTTLMRDTPQERYRAEVEVTVTTISSSHGVKPAVARTTAEIDVPRAEAAEFEKTVLGRIDTHRLAPITPAGVRIQPNVRDLLHIAVDSGVQPDLQLEYPRHLLTMEQSQQDPNEPLAVRSRRGQGFGMLLSLPGAERVHDEVMSVLRAKVNARQSTFKRVVRAAGIARGAKLARAYRNVSARFGTPALEGDLSEVLAGIDDTVRIDGTRYDISVVGHMGRRVDKQTYDLIVNARATGGKSVQSSRGGAKSLKLFGGGSARLKAGKTVKVEAGEAQISGGRGWKRSTALASGTKTYRRTETEGAVDDNLYAMVYEVKIRAGGPGGKVDTWYVHGDDVVARFAIPKQHRPARPIALAQDDRTGHERTDTPVAAPALIPPAHVGVRRPVSPALDLSHGTDAVYPSFAVIPELAEQASRLYHTLNRITWSDERWDWPERIRTMSKPTALQNGFDAAVSPRGWTERLPDRGGWKQSVMYELALLDTVHEKEHFEPKTGEAPSAADGPVIEGDGAVELEWLQQHSAHVSDGRGVDTGVTGSVGAGVVVKVGEESGEGAQNSESRKAANQVGAGLSASASIAHRQSVDEKQGSIDITRATYSGAMHSYRSDPMFKITVTRWKGDRKQTLTETVYAPKALEFMLPEARRRDLDLPLTATGARPVAPEQQADGTVQAMIDSELAISMSHPELLDAHPVLDAITDTLRKRGIIRRPTEAIPDGRKNDLMEYLEARFDSRALQNEFVNLRGTGVVGWYPMPSRFGAVRHLWIRVTGTLGEVKSAVPRDDVKLTIRAEKLTETEQEENFEHGVEVLFRGSGRGSLGDTRLGAGLAAGYSYQSGHSAKETETVRDIFRVGTSDKAVGYTIGMRYKVEMSVSVEPPQSVRLAILAAKKATFAAADLLARNKLAGTGMRKTWYKHRPSHWFETIEDRWNADAASVGEGRHGHVIAQRLPLTGSVRLLTPKHLTVASAQRHTPIIQPSSGRDVLWLPKAAPNTVVHSPAVPREVFELLRQVIHPNTVPATRAMQKWAGLTTVPEFRRPPELADGEAGHVPELGLDTLAGIQMSYLTGDTVSRADIVSLLDHTHQIRVRDKPVNIGVDIVRATRIQTAPVFKARRYKQAQTEPGQEHSSGGGFGYSIEFAGGRTLDGGSHVIDGGASFMLSNVSESISVGEGAGEVHEHDKEVRVGYRYYAIDVNLVIDGPQGALTLRVPYGLYAMLPEHDAAFVEQHAPDVFIAEDPILAPHDPLPEEGRHEVGEGEVESAAETLDAVRDLFDELDVDPVREASAAAQHREVIMLESAMPSPVERFSVPEPALVPAETDVQDFWLTSSICAEITGANGELQRACVSVAVFTIQDLPRRRP